jgi:ELWxxDGT repeat protein
VKVSAVVGDELTNVNGTLFFSHDDGIHGDELWKSDGTEVGTTLVKDIFPGVSTYFGPYSSSPSDLTNVNGTLFFTAYDSTVGQELWKSDGTEAGTTLVKDIFPGGVSYFFTYSPYSSNPANLTSVNGTLFFEAADQFHGHELWKSDGTAAGTVIVADINAGGSSSYPTYLVNVNGTLFFTAYHSTVGRELWKSDGTTAGTIMVKDINSGVANSRASGASTNLNGMLFFSATDGTHGYELWKSDGTTAGTVMVADASPGPSGSYPDWLTNANGTLFFTADDGIHGAELWTYPSFSGASTPSLDVSGFPKTTTAGAAGSFTVAAKNADGTTNAGYMGTVRFTTADPQATIIDPATGHAVALQGFTYTFTAADAGGHTFSATLKTAGTQSITAADAQTPTDNGTEGSILVNPAAANTMTVTGFPFSTTAGVMHNVTVTLKDPYGNIASGYAGTVHFTSTDSKAALPANYTFTAADAGTHIFSVTLKTAGTRSITAADTLASALKATEGGITVNPASASKFLITAPSTVSSGVPFNLTVTVDDAYGNVVIGYTGTVHFTSTDRNAKLPANYAFTAADKGVHTFTGLVLRKRGKQTITIGDTLNSMPTASGVENVL